MSTRYLPLFVYGTLQPGSRGYGSSLKNAVIESAPAYWAQASLYIGSSYPLAIRSIGGTGVYGSIMLIDQRLFAEILDELDEYEGYWGEGDPRNLYTRQVIEVEVSPQVDSNWEGPTQQVKAYVYVATNRGMRENRGQIVLSPSGDWHNHSLEWEQLSAELPEEDPWVDLRFADDIEE